MKTKSWILSSLILGFGLHLNAQGDFHPAAPHPESHAIHLDSNIIIAWATNAEVNRGYINARDTNAYFEFNGINSNRASLGSPQNAIGNTPAPVSLGDFGSAILSFEKPIVNGTGPDFVIFENGFPIGGDTSKYYLELAFVEVSSDGNNWCRFPATSQTQIQKQIGSFEGIDPTEINNLAGKYPYPYGTPFDLEELADCSANGLINLNDIRFVKVMDVGGMLDSLASKDHLNQPINDPYPTAFHSGGFDLTAVGVIHQQNNSNASLSVYPNPITRGKMMWIKGGENISSVEIFNVFGQKIGFSTEAQWRIPNHLASGQYFIRVYSSDGVFTQKLRVE